ncbi:MAG: chalcone isomerase family protein [Acidobacteriota bacterium]
MLEFDIDKGDTMFSSELPTFRPIFFVLACLLLVIGAAPPALGGELGGVQMADQSRVGDQSLVLNGLGLRKKAIFKVYVAGLYLPRRTSDPDLILKNDEARQLKMEFVRNVGGDNIAEAWSECLKSNNPSAGADVRSGFSDLGTWMSDFRKGDRLVFSYDPAAGTHVMVKGESKGTVAGKPFADALFRCWIGTVPPSEDFKAGLLGR